MCFYLRLYNNFKYSKRNYVLCRLFILDLMQPNTMYNPCNYIFRKLLGVKKRYGIQDQKSFPTKKFAENVLQFLSSLSSEINSRSNSVPNFPVTYIPNQTIFHISRTTRKKHAVKGL